MITDLHRRPAHLIRRAHQLAWALFLEECADFRITPVQYAALYAIRETPGVDATRLCGLIAFDRSTIGNVLERLERRKLIVRRPAPRDRRQKILSLSDEGERLLQSVEPFVARVQDRLLSGLDGEEKDVFLKLLARITSMSEAVAGSSSSEDP